ncbi:MAG: hypothetical protein JNN20_08075 [Betaproteobacteria bacterium]|nr:hypothetical protein [Betaproteobacteria bacterium]
MKKPLTLLAMSLVAAVSIPAHAAVTMFFSAGDDCKGKPEARFKPGAPVRITLCMSTTTEQVCGHSLRLEAENAAASGKFDLTARKLGALYPDPTLDKLPSGLTVNNPATLHDLGGTRDNAAPAGANQVVATFTLTPKTDAKDASYLLRLGPNSVASVGKNGTCEQSTETALSAGVTLKRD